MAMRISSKQIPPPTPPPIGAARPCTSGLEGTVGEVDGAGAELDVVAAREYMAYTLNVPVRLLIPVQKLRPK